MARRYIGDATIELFYRDRGGYAGRITVGSARWQFEDLKPKEKNGKQTTK